VLIGGRNISTDIRLNRAQDRDRWVPFLQSAGHTTPFDTRAHRIASDVLVCAEHSGTEVN
jgi:hypothetical protein